MNIFSTINIFISIPPDRGVDNKVLESNGNNFKQSRLSTVFNNFNNFVGLFLGILDVTINDVVLD